MDLPSEVLPTPGGPTKHRIGPFMLRLQPPHRKIVENAVFYFLQVIVVGVENLFRLRDFNFSARSLRPGQHGQPLDVVARDRIIGRHRRHARQAPQFFQRFLLHLVGHAGGFDLLPQFFGVPLAFVLLAQFFLDRLHLLAQIVFALRLLHAILHFRLDLVAQLLDFEFLGQMLIDFLRGARGRRSSPASPACRRWRATAATRR